MESETKTYEIAYLLKESGEEELEENVQKIRKTIEDEEGLVIQENRPQKQILGYPIKKNLTVNWGLFRFILPAEKIPALQKSFKKIDILRMLLTRTKPERVNTRSLMKKRIVRQPEESPAAIENKEEIKITEEAQEVSNEIKPEAEKKESLQVEEIDKKLEEILGE